MNPTKILLLFLALAAPSTSLLAQGNTWATGVPMPTSRVAPAAATINSTLYVIGGFTDASGPLSVVEVYDPLLNSWVTRSPMPTPRGRLAVGVINGILYAVGGFGGDTAMEAYDPISDFWTPLAPVNKGRSGAAAGAIGGKLYVVGGTANDSVQTLEEYDPTANVWVFKAPMPTPRFLLAAVVIGSKLYVVGGTNSLTGGPALGTLEVYDPATDTWETKAPMPTPRSDLAAAVIDGKMFVAGGFGAAGVGVTLEAYDPLLDTWSTLAPMPTSRGDLAADVLNNQLYAVAGVSAPGQTPLATVEIYTEASPVITSPLTASGTDGQFFVYQFEADGATTLDVTSLPAGLAFDPTLRAVTGNPTPEGTYNIALSASNSAGTTNATLVLTVQPVPAAGPRITSVTTATGRTGSPFKFQVLTTGGSPATVVAATGLPTGLSLDPLTGEISGTVKTDGSYLVSLSATDAGLTNTATLQLTFRSALTVPVIVSPNSDFIYPGVPFSFTIDAPTSDSTDPITYSNFGPLPPGLGLDPGTGVISGTPQIVAGAKPGPNLAGGIVTNTQIFACNSSGCATQGLFFLLPTGAANISTRLSVGTQDNVLIGGFITQGDAPMKLVARGIGPSLPVGGVLADPFLELHSGAATIAMNDNWKDNLAGGSQEVAIENTGIAPINDLEAAILAVLDPGAYTAIMKGTNSGTGVGLVEIYNLGAASLDVSSEARLANISTRGEVQTGDNVMIGGFINQGAVPIKVLIRGIGPSLTQAGVSGALANPVLELHNPDGSVVTNDDWQATHEAEITATTLAPTNALESAILVTLPVGEGAYTAIVKGVNNTTGVGLVEAYFGNPCLGASCP